MSPSDYKAVLLSDWENLGVGGGILGFSFKRRTGLTTTRLRG